VEAVRTTFEERKKQYRIVYELFWEKSRISSKDISTIIGSYVARKRMKEVRDQEYIVGPDIRKRSYQNLKEYVYFANCTNPERVYLKYREDKNVIYHAHMVGFCNLWIVAKEKMDIEGTILIEGPRSDYHVSYAPDHSWEKALEIMRKKIENFSPGTYKSKGIIKSHWDETITWDEKDEALYRYFKYDLRKPLSPVMRENQISGGKLYSWFERLPECCNINTHYYPDGLLSYDHYLFMFDTDYEDFIVDLFSELPATSSFFKVADKLFLLAYILRKYMRDTDLQINMEWYIPLLVTRLSEKHIIRNKEFAITMYSKGKNF
jgi:hypothetical protein